MPKPKGGRGKAAPYSTRQVRVPEPIIFQVNKLIDMYQDYISEGGDPANPPELITKPVNKFSTQYDHIIFLLEDSLKLKANAGGAIKKRIKQVLQLLTKNT